MSHFTVLVVGDDPESMLAPYDENLQTETERNADTWTPNPEAKWDWWVVGGRWSGNLQRLDGHGSSQLKRRDLDVSATSPTYAFLSADGWRDVEEHDDDDAWADTWRDFVRALPLDATLTLIDCHI